jgi:hypothetical protein
MNIFAAGFVTLLIIVLIISVIYFLRTPANPKDKALLITIRFVLIVAIALAFFEPELSLNRFSTANKSIALLIDNSKSMTNFSPDSTVVEPVNRILKSVSVSKKIAVKAFTFGDSLQPHTRFDQRAFSARQSEFPDISKGELYNADDIIIFSDAQWSSSAARINKLAERQVYYLPLNANSRRSYLDIDCSFIDSSTQRKGFAFKTTISGYLTKQNICTLTVSDNNRLFKSTVITIDSGSIDSTIIVPVTNRISGKHLFKTTLFNSDSSLLAQDYSVVTIPPKQFTYALHSTVPSLDLRFFTLALKKHPEFIKTSPQLADLSIFIGPWKDIQSTIDKIRLKSICAFIGVSQCDSFVTAGDHFKIVQNQSFVPVPFTIPLSDLPPPGALPSCRPELENVSTVLYLSNNSNTAPYPLLSTGNFSSRSALRVGFQGLWRWDFWPLSSSRGEEEPFLFSEYLIALCKEMIIAQTGSDLFTYPDFDKSENDSLVFAVSLPSELPLSQMVSVELRLLSLSGKPIHMSISKLTATGSLHYIKTRFPPDSIICYNVSLKHINKRFNYQDCFINQHANRELRVYNQNTSLLNQFAQPLQLDSDSAITTFFANLSSETKPLIKQVLPLRRTWWLIALILVLFSIEWYLRKKIE